MRRLLCAVLGHRWSPWTYTAVTRVLGGSRPGTRSSHWCVRCLTTESYVTPDPTYSRRLTAMPQTPTTGTGLHALDHEPPARAVARAWAEAGANPPWHQERRLELRSAMPLLARSLDRLAVEGVTSAPVPDRRDRLAAVLLEASRDAEGWCWSMNRANRTADLLLQVLDGRAMYDALGEARAVADEGNAAAEGNRP